MKERESLRKKIVPIIASPIMAMVIGFSVAVGGFVEGTIYLKDLPAHESEEDLDQWVDPAVLSPNRHLWAVND